MSSNGPPIEVSSAPSGGVTILVFERLPRWEPELLRQFGEDHHFRIRGCRSLTDLDVFTERMSVIAVLHLPDRPAEIVRWLSRGLVSRHSIPSVVIVGRAQTELEWHVRESGAVAVLDDYTSGRRLASACRQLAY